jgi:hypothetical protein
MHRTILRAFATYSMLGVTFLLCSVGFVAGQETHASGIAADSQIASFLTKIETGLKENQLPYSAGLLDMLVSAKMLMPDATPEGMRLVQNFPGRLIALADQESRTGELAKSMNMRVFADSAAPFIGQKPEQFAIAPQAAASPTPVASAAPLVSDGHKIVADQQQIAMVQPTKIVPKDDVTIVPGLQQNVAAAKPMAHAKPTVPPVIDLAMQHTLLDRGDTLLTLGDILAARLLYQRAAESGVAIAAFKLANTYDSAFLVEHQDLRSVRPDLQQAAMWYRKAQELGEPHAEQRLNALSEQLRKVHD